VAAGILLYIPTPLSLSVCMDLVGGERVVCVLQTPVTVPCMCTCAGAVSLSLSPRDSQLQAQAGVRPIVCKQSAGHPLDRKRPKHVKCNQHQQLIAKL
jgi:hypothetical protein